MGDTILIKEEVRKLGETTTVRGVPRVFKSTDTVLRTIWACAVCVCSGLLVWQLSTLVIRYYSRDSSTLFTQKLTKSVFPDLTICNAYPLNNIDLNIWQSYLANLTSAKEKWTCAEIRKKLNLDMSDLECNYTWWQLSLPSGLFSTLSPFNDATGDKKLITDCSFYNWDWGISDIDCSANTQIVWDDTYYKCYRIQVPTNKSQTILGLHAVLYINDFTPVTLNEVSSDLGDTMSTGVRLAVHAPGTEPDLQRGLNIGPGVETTVKLSVTERRRLQSPYPSQCTDQKFVTNSTTIQYTTSSCYQVCVQSQIIQQCNCISGNFLFTEYQMKLAKNTLCGNWTVSNANADKVHDLKAFSEIYCYIFNTSNIDYESCIENCNSPCVELLYDTSVSTSGPSPSVGYQAAFYEAYIADSSFADKFSGYPPLFNGYESVNLSQTEFFKELLALDLIGRNFVQLNVLFERINPYLMVDKPSLTLDALWAQIGGMLSLWLGITIMNAFEIVECIYSLIKKARNSKQPKATSHGRSEKDSTCF